MVFRLKYSSTLGCQLKRLLKLLIRLYYFKTKTTRFAVKFYGAVFVTAHSFQWPLTFGYRHANVGLKPVKSKLYSRTSQSIHSLSREMHPMN